MCKRLTLAMVLLISAVSLAIAGSNSVQDLKDRVELAPVKDRPGLCMEIVEKQLKSADQLYLDGKPEQARAAVADIVHYSDVAKASAITSGKKIKNTEISLRKIAGKLRDIERVAGADQQASINQAADHLEDLRTELINQVFSK